MGPDYTARFASLSSLRQTAGNGVCGAIPTRSDMKKYFPAITLFLFLFFSSGFPSSAEELTPVVDAGPQEIVITAKEDAAIGALYIEWNNPVAPYQLVTETGTQDCGTNGFLHEFIPLAQKSKTLTLQLPGESPMELYHVRIFEDTDVPEDVQIWQPPCERADILLVSAHADDEILFMGGIIPTYGAEGGARVQVVYMAEFWSTAPVREHEKLNGLWTDGLRNYPVCGNFRDVYAEDLAHAETLYDPEEMTDFLTQTILRFQPQVVVTHDFNGEYGHGFHQLTAKTVSQALEAAADPALEEPWDVPKAYFHLYPEHTIHMDLNLPLESMGGQTALEVAKAAYLQHVSQQWCWFYVSDTYEYSCADFGLYRTNVGYDTGDSMLENILLYDAQEEQARLEQEAKEREAREKAEAEEKLREEQLQQEALRREQEEALRAEQEQLQQKSQEQSAKRKAVLFAGGAVFLLILILVLVRRAGRK